MNNVVIPKPQYSRMLLARIHTQFISSPLSQHGFQLMGERKLRMVENDEVSEATGYVVRAVPPISLSDDVPVLVDNRVTDIVKKIVGSGILAYVVLLSLLADSARVLHAALWRDMLAHMLINIFRISKATHKNN